MIRIVQKRNVMAMLLAVILAVLTVAPVSSAQYRRHHRVYRAPSKTKHIAVGTAIGAVGGALIGGRKGALIGAGAGAGTGYMVYRHKKHHRRY